MYLFLLYGTLLYFLRQGFAHDSLLGLSQRCRDRVPVFGNPVCFSHLTSVKQKHDEPVTSYIRRFRETKNRCYNLVISERDLAELAFNGFDPILKKN